MFLPESLIYFLQLSFTQSAVIYGFKGPGSMLVHMLCSPNQVSGQTTGCKFLRTICLLINNESSHVLFDTCSDLLVNQSRVSSSGFFFPSMQCYCWKMSQQEARRSFFLARGTSRESVHSKNSFVTSYSFTLSPCWGGSK